MILVCAATGTEAEACRRGIAAAGAPGFRVLTTGVGPGRAAGALARCLGDEGGSAGGGGGLTLVVSAGFAGALTPGLEPLSWVTATGLYRLVDGRALEVALAPGLLRVAEDAVACEVVSADHVLAGSVAGVGGPAVADMESAALAEVAGAAGIPFMVLRLVSDTPRRPLPRVGRSVAAALAERGFASRAAHGARAVLDAMRSPAGTAAFLHDAAGWRERLRAGWREHASRGLPSR